MEDLLCFDPPPQHTHTLFLKIASLCWPLHERNFGTSCVWKHVHAHFPSMFGRHWAVASSVAVENPMPVWCPVFHTWPVQSLETFRLLFIRGVLKFHNDTALWDVLFLLFHQLSLTFGNSYSSVPWNFLNYFFENDFFLHLFSISGPLWHYLDFSFVVYFPPPYFLSPLFVFVCF